MAQRPAASEGELCGPMSVPNLDAKIGLQPKQAVGGKNPSVEHLAMPSVTLTLPVGMLGSSARPPVRLDSMVETPVMPRIPPSRFKLCALSSCRSLDTRFWGGQVPFALLR
jgi:hypothetical protein